MANRDIVVTFKPQGHEAIVDALKRLERAQKGFSKTTDKANKKLGAFDAKTKRNAQSMSGLGLAFSTVRSKLLLLNFAMSLGVIQLTKMVQQAAKLEGMERAFVNLSGGANQSSIALDKLRKATNNTMSDFDLFQQANNAMVLGVTKNSDEMAQLFDMAQRLGRILGVDTKRAVESLITGLGRQSPLMLDNIGITVRANEAQDRYADILGTTADKLTDAQKKQAFLNEAIRKGKEALKDAGPEVLTTQDDIDELNAAFTNLSTRIGEAIIVFKPLANAVVGFANAISTPIIKNTLQLILALAAAFIAVKLAIMGAALAAKAIVFFLFRNFTIQMAGAATVTTTLAMRVKDLGTRFTGLITTVKGATTTLTGFFFAAQKYLFGGEDPKLLKKINQISKEMTTGLKEILKTQSDIIDLDYNNVIGETMGLSTDMADILNLLEKAYENTEQGQLKLLDSQIQFARSLAELGLLTPVQLEGLIALEEQYYDLAASIEASGEASDGLTSRLEALNKFIETSDAVSQISQDFAMIFQNEKQLSIAALRLAQFSATGSAIAGALKHFEDTGEFFTSMALLTAGLAQAAQIQEQITQAQQVSFSGGGAPKFAQGGYVGGNLHSQGGTMIEAERGEFVMSRNAVESIGLETLNQMNQSGGGAGINVTVTGNVLTQDFVENELAESIKEAIRKGSDFGIS